MKLALAYSLTAAALHGATAQNTWYPNWFGASQTCLDDGKHPYSMEINGSLEPTLADCCERYYQSRINECIVDGGGTPPPGSGKFYVNYGDKRCDSDCPEGSGTCGGYATPADTLYNNIDLCCSSKLSHLSAGYCSFNSNRAGGDYPGTLAWYSESNRCVQDCKTTGGPCDLPGGVILDSYVTLYDTAALCCAAKFPIMDQDLCASLSSSTSTGTLKFFPDTASNMCIVDSDAGTCPTGATCKRAPVTAKLFNDEEACCASMPWVNSDYCESRSAGDVTDMWYADGQICMQDCVGPLPCKELTNAYAKLDADESACCANQLGWVDSGICVATAGGAAPTGSGGWYVDYENKRCIMDCPLADPVNPLSVCGGLAAGHEQLFGTPEACCAGRLSYFASGFCLANSERLPYGGSMKWRVDYQSSSCVQDCPTGAGDTCGGIIEDASTLLHVDAATCCGEQLRWLDQNICTATSMAGAAASPTGTSQWYAASNGDMKCVRDCDSGDQCGGILSATSSTSTYADITECCSKHFSYIDSSLCAAVSQLQYTQKWFVDYQNNRCQQHCAAASDSPCAGNPSDMSITLYNDPNACCGGKLSYINPAQCYANSLGVAPQGTNEFYVDWMRMQCVQDCDDSFGGSCGGLMPYKQDTFTTALACCQSVMKWKDPDDCIYP